MGDPGDWDQSLSVHLKLCTIPCQAYIFVCCDTADKATLEIPLRFYCITDKATLYTALQLIHDCSQSSPENRSDQQWYQYKPPPSISNSHGSRIQVDWQTSPSPGPEGGGEEMEGDGTGIIPNDHVQQLLRRKLLNISTARLMDSDQSVVKIVSDSCSSTLMPQAKPARKVRYACPGLISFPFQLHWCTV